MSARLKLKNLKKRIETIESYGRHCEFEIKRLENILSRNMEAIGCNIQLEPVDTLRDAIGVLERKLHEAARQISITWTRQIAVYLRDRIIDEYRFDTFRTLGIRVFLPKPTAEFVKVESMTPRRFF